ncbi:recombinase family protein [Streptomyces sp. NPDC021622]|uniref:recombinase family protein n=1 Tax=Streptomyces sp. NPDC021622 TaxID=3155013 RepID=UPI0033D02DC7
MAFVFKCLQWGKSIVILDDPSFTEKMQTVEGRVIIHAQAIGPAKELERIKKRTKESFEARLYTIAWTNGIPSYGYTSKVQLIETSPGEWEERSVRVVDIHCKDNLHWMRQRLIEDPTETLEGLCRQLEQADELTAADRWREKKKRCKCKEERHNVRTCPKRERWRSSNLKVILTNDSLRGVKRKNGKVLHWPDGSEVLVAEPIFNKQEWETLQTALQERNLKTTRVKTGKTEPTPPPWRLGLPRVQEVGHSGNRMVEGRQDRIQVLPMHEPPPLPRSVYPCRPCRVSGRRNVPPVEGEGLRPPQGVAARLRQHRRARRAAEEDEAPGGRPGCRPVRLGGPQAGLPGAHEGLLGRRGEAGR